VDGAGTPTAGMYLGPGGTGWNVYSDRSFKTNLRSINSIALLQRLAAIPISSWNYKSQDASVQHIGPMAQDFNNAFGLGEPDKSGDKKYINSIDADGVALAAIQGLYQLNQQQAAEIQSLKARINKMEKSGSTPPAAACLSSGSWSDCSSQSQAGLFLVLRRKMGGKS